MDAQIVVLAVWVGGSAVAALGYGAWRIARRASLAGAAVASKDLFLALLLMPWIFTLVAFEGAGGAIVREWLKLRGAHEATCPTCGQRYLRE